MADTPTTKWAVQSKTIGLNVLSIGLWAWQHLTGVAVLDPQTQVLGTALLNILLRLVTSTPISLLPPDSGLPLPK